MKFIKKNDWMNRLQAERNSKIMSAYDQRIAGDDERGEEEEDQIVIFSCTIRLRRHMRSKKNGVKMTNSESSKDKLSKDGNKI